MPACTSPRTKKGLEIPSEISPLRLTLTHEEELENRGPLHSTCNRDRCWWRWRPLLLDVIITFPSLLASLSSSSPLCVQSAHASRLHFQPIPMCKRDVDKLGEKLHHLDSPNMPTSQNNVREISRSPTFLFFLLRRYNPPSASRFPTSSLVTLRRCVCLSFRSFSPSGNK